MTSQWTEIRQMIASARGDIDLLIELESAKAPHQQDIHAMAEHLLSVGRASEALVWIRKPGSRVLDQDDPLSPAQVSLEARIPGALDDKTAAQNQRWHCFEAKLSPEILREYLKALPGFEDIEAEERALQVALSISAPKTSVWFFLEWSRPDLAAQVVIQNHTHWDGSDWHSLPKLADLLEPHHAAAATILYRALLEDILQRGRSKAYGHGATYLAKLTSLSREADPNLPETMERYETWLLKLHAAHNRKSAFWSRID
ncbi:MAG: hypothetical protein N4A70_06345 [Pelagimonas sp.]|jgi:hypothetical protein|nr:hypothetical protein [Pelagimonas sp.]